MRYSLDVDEWEVTLTPSLKGNDLIGISREVEGGNRLYVYFREGEPILEAGYETPDDVIYSLRREGRSEPCSSGGKRLIVEPSVCTGGSERILTPPETERVGSYVLYKLRNYDFDPEPIWEEGTEVAGDIVRHMRGEDKNWEKVIDKVRYRWDRFSSEVSKMYDDAIQRSEFVTQSDAA